jgi:glycosyltransferase 2 family protein
MRALQHPGSLAGFVFLTFVAWGFDSIFAIQIASALHLSLSFFQALILLAALGLSSAIPSTPGYIGIYQFVAVSLFPLFGFTQSQSLAYIIILQAIAYLSVILWGFMGLWRLNALQLFKPSQLKQLTNRVNEDGLE